MAQRLSGYTDAEAQGLAKEILEASSILLGRSSNLLRILAKHSPFLARWFIGFVGAVRQPNLGAVSDIRVRNLATIKTSMANECSYCSAHTSIFGQTLGLKTPTSRRSRTTPTRPAPPSASASARRSPGPKR